MAISNTYTVVNGVAMTPEGTTEMCHKAVGERELR